MKKFYSKNCLISKVFIKDYEKTTADQVLTETTQKAGGETKIERFV